MNNKLYEAGFIAIPLKQQEGIPLSPNFMIVENIFNKVKAEIPTIGITDCMNSMYKIVYREILPATETKQEDFREVLLEQANQAIPIDLIPAFGSYERLLASKEQVDGMLSLFSFRGVLEGFVPIIDEEVVNNILEEINLINIQNNLEHDELLNLVNNIIN